MQTKRLVLKVPFMRYPAGTVFELEDRLEYDGWEEDERLREKQNFSDRRVFFLPDGGSGFSTMLSAYDTQPCPPAVFEGVDLHSGPCRITKIELPRALGPGLCVGLGDSDISLVDMSGCHAQGIAIRWPEGWKQPLTIALRDILRDVEVPEVVGPPDEVVDFSGLLPGFYHLLATFPNGCVQGIRFIKSFPLLVFFERGTFRYTTQKTLY